MPRKNVIKTYAPDSFYHVYNRGVDKMVIFKTKTDYLYFTSLLLYYLCPDDNLAVASLPTRRGIRQESSNLSSDVALVSYCLMPNHFHLLIKQKSAESMTRLMKRVSNSYASYFNLRYSRTGHLFESNSKAVLIETDEQLIHTSRYIHLNPLTLGVNPLKYQFSNFSSIVYDIPTPFTKTDLLLEYFDASSQKYHDFVSAREVPLRIMSG